MDRAIPMPHPGAMLREEFLTLATYFGVGPRWFLNMQAKHELHVQKRILLDELAAIATRAAA